MSDQVTNGQLLAVLMDVKQDIGEIKATVASHAVSFNRHVEEDKELAEDVERLRLASAKRSGASGVWALVAGAAGSLIGLIASYVTKH